MVYLEFSDQERFEESSILYSMDIQGEIRNDEFEFKVEVSGSYKAEDYNLKKLIEKVLDTVKVHLMNA
jgi:hypothetical protein